MSVDASNSWRRAWPVLVLAALAVVAAPLLSAGFHSDDWIWLALVRHLDSPLPVYGTGILHEYFYRPSSVALWWLGEWLAGHSAAGHYALDIAVHGISCVALVALLRCHRVSLAAAVFAGLLFAVAPTALGTVSWLSNRNELLAIAAGFGFLLALERALRQPGWWLPMLLLAVSVTSKETGLVFASAGVLRLLWARREGVAFAPWLWLAVLLPVAGLFVLRRLTLLPVGVSISPSTAPAGVAGWFQTLPSALAGFASAGWLIALLAALLLALGVIAIWAFWRSPMRRGLPLATAGCLLLLPPLLQWPITHQVFADAGARLFTENLRFFYLASAALAMLLAVLLDRANRPWRRALFPLLLVGVLLPAAFVSQGMTRAWARSTGPSSAQILDLARPVAAASYPAGCTILLERGQWPTAFPTFADAIVKYAAEPGASVLDCAVFTQIAPAHTLLRREACDAAHWPALRLRRQQDVPVLRALGNVCLAGFERPLAPTGEVVRIDLDRPVTTP